MYFNASVSASKLIESMIYILWTGSFHHKCTFRFYGLEFHLVVKPDSKYRKALSVIRHSHICKGFLSFHFPSPRGLQKLLPPQFTHNGTKYLIHSEVTCHNQSPPHTHVKE